MSVINDHADRSTALLLEQFKRSPRLHDLVRALVEPLQGLENVFQDLLTLRALDTAFGAQLDGIGEIVDEPRQGRSDADYLPWLKLRIFINVSKGRPEDMIHVLKVITEADQVRYFENHPASMEMFTDGLSIPEVGEVKTRILSLDHGGSLALDDGGALLLWTRSDRSKPFLVRLMENLAGGGVGPVPVVISLGQKPLAFGADPETGFFALDDDGLLILEDSGGLLLNSTDTSTGSYGEGGHLADIGFDTLGLDDNGGLITESGGGLLLLDQEHQNVVHGDGKLTEVLQ